MSRKKDESLFYDEEINCPPPNEVSKKKDSSSFNKEKKEEEKAEIRASDPSGHVPLSNPNDLWAINEDRKTAVQDLDTKNNIGIKDPGASGGGHVISTSRGPHVSPGAAAVGNQAHHPNVVRRNPRTPEPVSPGAFRVTGLDNEEGVEEDELTIGDENAEEQATAVTHEESSFSVSAEAELVNAEEEEKRLEDKINQALQNERQLVQDQINQALQTERQNAVVAEVVPEVISDRGRRWKLAGALFLMILIVVAVVLGVTLPQDPESALVPTSAPTVSLQEISDLLSSVSSDGGEALLSTSTPQSMAFMWLAGDSNIASYTDQEKIQRYALATLFYSTSGKRWNNNSLWVTNEDVCDKWYQTNYTTIDCTGGAVSRLDLDYNNLEGTIPPEIGLLTALVYLSLSHNSLSGAMPSEIGMLSDSLVTLNLDAAHLQGSIPSEIGMLSNSLRELKLPANSLEGRIPTEAGQLKQLTTLQLQFNSLEGQIPTEVGQLKQLTILDINHNNLSGTIPPEIGMLSNSLQLLWLYGNNLNGTVPSEIGQLTQLNTIGLCCNELTGTINPSIVNNLTSLNYLFFFDNMFTGSYTCPGRISRCHISCDNDANLTCRSL